MIATDFIHIGEESIRRLNMYVSHTSAFRTLIGCFATTYRVESGFVDKYPQGTERDTLTLWNALSVATGIPASCVVNSAFTRARSVGYLQEQFDAWWNQNRQAINQLERLDVIGCRDFPYQMRQLTHLKELYIAKGDFTTLPDEVYYLPNLKKLSIHDCHNHITLGPKIGRLTQLTKLSIHNPIYGVTLPDEIGGLQNLTELCLSGLRRAPPAIGRLYQLEKLYIVNSPQVELPYEIGDLSNLREAVFRDNYLRTIPDSFAALNAQCRFDFTGNLVSDEVLKGRIAALRGSGVAARYAELTEAARRAQAANFEAQIEDAEESFEQTLLFWLTEYPKNFSKFCENQSDRLPKDGACPAFYNPLLYHPERGKLSLFLERLKASKDYTDGGTSQIQLTRRVYRMLELAASDLRFCDILFPLLHDACSTCHDRPALVFNRVEMQMELFTAKEKDEKALAKLCIGLKRVELLQKCAEERIAKHGLPDPIEVFLFYETQLRKQLELPVSTQNMIFKNYAGISPEMLQEDATQVLSKTQSPDDIRTILLEQEVWHERMKQIHQKAFKELEDGFGRQMEELSKDTAMGDGQKDIAMKDVMTEREKASQRFVMERTNEWIASNLKQSS